MNPIVRSISALIPAVFVALALPSAAQAQPGPGGWAPTAPPPPSGPGATPGFTGHAPSSPSDPTSPYYEPSPTREVVYVQQPPAPIVGGVVAPDGSANPDRGPEPSPKRTGLEVGLRTGVGFPMSSVMSGTTLSTFVSNEVPVWFSLGYRVTENLYLGLYGQYGFISVNGCGQYESCNAYDVRAGIDVQYHPQPRELVDPWIGYGAGFERLGLSVAGDASGSIHFDGFELANLQAGLDWRVSRALTIGPFGSFSVGQYTSVSNDSGSVDIAQTAMHEWLMIGLRAQLM